MAHSYMLDVTRLIAHCWLGGPPTGIDRVCLAYMEHFGPKAHAVIQYRGFFRVLTLGQSEELFTFLRDYFQFSRWDFIRFTPFLIGKGANPTEYLGKTYINVGHTDFDLPFHWKWIRENALRSVYLIHDLIPITHPHLTSPHAIARHTARVTSALSHSDGIITNSASVARDVLDFSKAEKIMPPPVKPIRLGADHIHNPVADTCSRPNNFVCVSTIEHRKNHLMLLRIWKKLIARLTCDTPNLLLIGQLGRKSEEVLKFINSDPVLVQHVSIIENCNDHDMAKHVVSAKAVLLPSLAEGYGLPLAEAMALGTPTIVSDLPCAREIGSGIPLYISPTNEIAWENAIMDCIVSHKETHRQRQLLQQHQPKTWNAHFQLFESWVQQLPNRDHLEKQRDGLSNASINDLRADHRESVQ